MSSYDLEIEQISGNPSQWKRYLRKQGYHSIIKSRERQFDTFGKGTVDVTVWELFSKDDIDVTVWNSDVKYPVQFSIKTDSDEKQYVLQQQSVDEFAHQFQGKVRNPQTDEVLRKQEDDKKKTQRETYSYHICGPGRIWVPSYHKHNGTYVKGFCREKAK